MWASLLDVDGLETTFQANGKCYCSRSWCGRHIHNVTQQRGQLWAYLTTDVGNDFSGKQKVVCSGRSWCGTHTTTLRNKVDNCGLTWPKDVGNNFSSMPAELDRCHTAAKREIRLCLRESHLAMGVAVRQMLVEHGRGLRTSYLHDANAGCRKFPEIPLVLSLNAVCSGGTPLVLGFVLQLLLICSIKHRQNAKVSCWRETLCPAPRVVLRNHQSQSRREAVAAIKTVWTS